MHWDGAVLTITGVAMVPGVGTSPTLLGWTHDLLFSASDNNTVAWGSGTITLGNGVSFSIDAGNTGNISAPTYVFLDTAVSTTVLQITTSASAAVGLDRILIAVAEDVALPDVSTVNSIPFVPTANVPSTTKRLSGVVVPMPTLPLVSK